MEDDHEALPLTAQPQRHLQLQEDDSSSSARFRRRRECVTVAASSAILGLFLFLALAFRHRGPRNAAPSAHSSSVNRLNNSRIHDQTGFHFQPPGNWMNEPNGPVFYRGYYHIFYQFNPRAAIWHMNMSWGHAASTDLIHWTHLPIALEPSHWYDSNGCWSGSITLLVENSTKPMILYTGISKDLVQTQNAAVPEDLDDPLLRRWKKVLENPLIPAPPSGIGRTDFRDPTSAWKDSADSAWRIIIGSKNGSSGIGFLYESTNFISWHRTERPIFSAEGTGMLECPDFFPVSDSKHVFKASLGDPSVIGGVDDSFDTYVVGSYSPANATFLPDLRSVPSGFGSRLDHGNRFYASKSFADPKKNRRILWGWLPEADSQTEDVAKGWASIQSIPRSIWLDPEQDTSLMQLPVEEIASLRAQPGIIKSNLSLQPGSVLHIQQGASQIDAEIVFRLPDMTMQTGIENFDVDSSSNSGNAAAQCRKKGSAVNGILGPFGLLVLATKELQEQTAIFFHLGRSRKGLVALVCADHTRSSSSVAAAAATVTSSNFSKPLLHGAFVHLVDSSTSAAEQELSLRVLVDRSVVETFAQGGKVCLTSRVYPMHAKGDAANLFLFNNGTGSVEVQRLSAWKMNSVW